MSSAAIQDQAYHYAKLAFLQLYSLLTTVVFHLSSVTANLIDEYPQSSSVLTAIFALIVSVYLIKNLLVFAIKSVVKLVKLGLVFSFIVFGVVVYFRGVEFFTVDLVNLYHLIVKDVEQGTVYSNQILDNFSEIYKETLNNGEVLEKNKYLQLALSKSEQYKKIIANFF